MTVQRPRFPGEGRMVTVVTGGEQTVADLYRYFKQTGRV